jgi:predicted nucleotidyltransferase
VHRYEEIRDQLASMKPSLQREYGVEKIGLFGAYVRNEQTEDSDLDVLVEFDEPVSLFDLVRLENELADRLEVDVDLVTKDSLKPRIEARVTEDLVYV